MRTTAFIDVDLWDRAQWFGVAFLGPRGDVSCPRLGLVFRDQARAVALFAALQRRLGARDEREELQVAFVEGARGPAGPSYTAVITLGTGPSGPATPSGPSASSAPERAAPPSRSQQLGDSGALAAFRRAVETHRRYLLTPIVIDAGAGGQLRALEHLTIEKREVVFHRADEPPVSPASPRPEARQSQER